MGTRQEPAYLTYFKGAESQKNWFPSKMLSVLPSNLHIKILLNR